MSSATAIPEGPAGAAAPAKPAGRGKIVLILVVAAVFLVGAGAGLSFSALFGATDAPGEAPHAEAEPESHKGARQEVDVGRITVVIPADRTGGGRLHLLVAPLVVAYPEAAAGGDAKDGHGGGGGGDAAAPTAELRDAFIEYLAQLRESDVRGSAGLAALREELLRRARAVAPELNAEAVLIQDFVIQ